MTRAWKNGKDWLLVGLLVCLGGSVHAQSGPSPQAAAIVNGVEIPVVHVQELLRFDRPPVHPLTEKQKKEMQLMAIDMLVNDILMRQFLAKNAPPVSDEAVNTELTALSEALAKKKLTMEKFLQDTKQTPQELRDDIRAKLQWEAYVVNKLPDSLIQKYYDANKVFFDKVFVKASHVLIKLDENATAAEKQTARFQLNEIRKAIVSGRLTFEDAAKKFSDCPSKDKGGDIGHFPYKFAVAEPFARAAFSMPVGQISEIVETGFGFHLIKVTERTKGEPSNFADIKDVVRDVYVQDLQLQQRILTEERNRAKIEILLP